MSQQKNIVYASDEKFTEILAVSMESLLQHNSDVTLYILNNGMSQESVEKLTRQTKKYNCEIHFVPVKKLEDYAGRALSCQKKISKTAYFRLFLPDLLPESIERLLYLDCDTMVMSSLDKLFDFEIKGLCAAMVEPTARLMKKKISLDKNDLYFNSGVMLIDLKKWRKSEVVNNFISYMNQMKGNISFEDQGVLNHVLYGQIDVFPFKYNVTTQFFDFGYDGLSIMKNDKIIYSRKEVMEGMNHPAVIHFTNSFSSERPWVKGCEHKYGSEWKRIKMFTEWSDSDLWTSEKDAVRRICWRIYTVLPGKLKYKFIYLVNGVIRALLSVN